LAARASLRNAEAWHRSHPDQRPDYAARQTVAVILAAKVKLRVDDA